MKVGIIEMTARELLTWAKQEYQKEKSNMRDYQTLVFMLRDNEHIEAAGLTDLCWAMDRDGNITEGDVEGLLEYFEAWINKDLS